MRTGRRKSSSLTSRPRGARCGGCRPRAGNTACKGFHETRNTAFWAARAAVPAVKSRLPGSLLPAIAHYCPVPLPPSCCCPQLPAIARHFPAFLPSGHGLPAHDGPLLPTSCPLQILPGASLHAPSVILGRPHGERHGPRLPSSSGLLPLGRTQNGPMLRKENVPDCVDTPGDDPWLCQWAVIVEDACKGDGRHYLDAGLPPVPASLAGPAGFPTSARPRRRRSGSARGVGRKRRRHERQAIPALLADPAPELAFHPSVAGRVRGPLASIQLMGSAHWKRNDSHDTRWVESGAAMAAIPGSGRWETWDTA